MRKEISINEKKYTDTLNRVMEKAGSISMCAELLNKKNRLIEGNPKAREALLELDEILSDYYGVVLETMYAEVFERVINVFCPDE